MSLRGSLQDFGLPEVFQLIAQQGKSGILEVRADGGSFEVAFRDGRVVRACPAESKPDDALAELLLRTGVVRETELRAARARQKSTLESLAHILEASGTLAREELVKTARILTNDNLFDLFRCKEGSFRFRPETIDAAPGDEDVGADHVVLDAMRMQDEWPLIAARLPDLAMVPIPALDLETFQGRKGALDGRHGIAEAVLEQIFRLVDGRHSARRVIDLSRLGTFEGARALVALERAEFIRFEEASRGSETETRTRERPRLGALLPGLGMIGIAAALAGVLWVSPSGPGPVLPIAADALRASELEAEGARIRNALEVERWVSGAYPSSLEELRARGLAPLAPREGGRYSYARAGGDYRLYRSYP